MAKTPFRKATGSRKISPKATAKKKISQKMFPIFRNAVKDNIDKTQQPEQSSSTQVLADEVAMSLHVPRVS